MNNFPQFQTINNAQIELFNFPKLSYETKIISNHILELQKYLSQKSILPIEPLILPPVHVNCLPEDFFDEAIFLTQDTELNITGAYLALAGLISCALWGRVVVKVHETCQEPAVDYIIQYAESGMRKTAFMERLIYPIQETENTINNNCGIYANRGKKIYLSYFQEGIIRKSIYKQLEELEINLSKVNKELEAVGNQWEELEKMKNEMSEEGAKLICKGGTWKGIERSMQTQGGTQAILSSDSNFLVNLFMEPCDIFLQAHTQEKYNRVTHRKVIEIPRPALPMVLLTQPSQAKILYKNEKIKLNGLLNRMIPFFHTRHGFSSEKIVDSKCHQIFINKVKTLLSKFFSQNHDANRLVLNLDDRAKKLLYDFEKEISNSIELAKWGEGWLSKLHGQAIRFAADIHCWNNPTDPGAKIISDVEMNQGIYLARCAMPHACFAFSPFGLCTMYDAKRILSSLYRINDLLAQNNILFRGTSSLDIARRTGISHERAKNGLRYLENCNYLIAYDDGSPTLRIALHPRIFYEKII